MDFLAKSRSFSWLFPVPLAANPENSRNFLVLADFMLLQSLYLPFPPLAFLGGLPAPSLANFPIQYHRLQNYFAILIRYLL
ncbi:hypothetical protein LQF76_07955 [Gloeomargaritales cyanobacterium VI4D9]|nr:hypothetical protein LQF76_07955 [Gloeomargaritales cyanobacterium VI4D9]